MTLRLYFVPATGSGASRLDARRPKYFRESGLRGTSMDFGLEPVFAVAADLTGAQHVALVANVDVTALPVDLDGSIGGALGTVQAALEALGIPAEWVTVGMTYRQVVRVVLGLFLFAQRVHGLGGGRLLPAGVTLDTRFNQLGTGARSTLLEAANSFEFDTATLTGASLLRQILRAMGQAWGERKMQIGGLVI